MNHKRIPNTHRERWQNREMFFFCEKARFAGSANPLIIFYILSFYLQRQRHLPTAKLYLHYLYDAD